MIPYTLVRSNRKTISIVVKPNGEVEVRCPKKCSKREAEAFVASKENWIRKHLDAMAPLPAPFTDGEIAELTAKAKAWFPQRTAHWAARMGLRYGRITVRHQRGCWGSCSAKGNLNFNCVLMLAPTEIADYVIVHELCHLVHPDHSKAFWALVESTMPGCAAHRRWLRDHSRELIGRIP